MKNRFNQSLNELDGHLELGMAAEALRLAKAILKQRPVSALAFSQAVQAALIQADNLKPWRRSVESAYESLNRKQCRPHSRVNRNFRSGFPKETRGVSENGFKTF